MRSDRHQFSGSICIEKITGISSLNCQPLAGKLNRGASNFVIDSFLVIIKNEKTIKDIRIVSSHDILHDCGSESYIPKA